MAARENSGNTYGDTPVQLWCVTSVGYDPSPDAATSGVCPSAGLRGRRPAALNGAESSFVIDQPDTDCT